MYNNSKVVRTPDCFEDCVANLRMEDCKFCSFRPRRGIDWKNCSLRVRMFLKEGGNIV